MPVCPSCRAEYRPGYTRCVDCEVDLVADGAFAGEANDDPDDRWAVLCTITSEIEAQLVQGLLETEGVPCTLESLKFHAEPVNFGPLSKIRLHVLGKDLERARELLADRDLEVDPADEEAAEEPAQSLDLDSPRR